MKNEEKAQEISEKYKHYNVECSSLDCYLSALEMAKYKDSQPQIIEIFGKRVKIVEDNDSSAKVCMNCAFSYECTLGHLGICRNADGKFNRHFVEVDEDGNEIQQRQKSIKQSKNYGRHVLHRRLLSFRGCSKDIPEYNQQPANQPRHQRRMVGSLREHC